MPFAISPHDAARLLTLSDPTLSPLQLAAWLAQPHIQQALEALEHLRALQRQRYHEQVAQEAIDTLRELSKTTDDPIERRRAATTILRALTRANRPDRPARDHTQTRPRSASEGLPTPTPPCGGGQAHAQRAPGGGASPTPALPFAISPGGPALRAGSSSPTPPSDPSASALPVAHLPFAISSPHSVSPSLPLSVSALPSSARLDPDTLTAELTTRLRALDAPTPESVRTTIWEGLDIKVWRDPKRSLDLSARIADGPLCDPALRATTPTVEHLDTTDSTATRRLRWPDTALLLQLVYDDGDNASFFPRHWTLADITTNHDPPNSS